MFHRPFISRVSLLIPVLLGAAMPAHAQRPASWFVPNVVEQFNALTDRADPLGFHIADSPNPSTCKHYQGLARLEGPDGTPYLIVTRSGNTPDVPGPDDPVCDDSPGETGHGNFIVVRMGSRDTHGERFRSNRQTKGHGIDVTPPDPRDRVATWFKFQPGIGFPYYGHPGGMQTSGHMLALAVEHPYVSGIPKTVVLIINMKDPINPEIRSTFPIESEVGEKAGLVALTQLADGHYLMMVTGGSNEKLQFYRSTLTDLMTDTLSWVPLDAWSRRSPLSDRSPGARVLVLSRLGPLGHAAAYLLTKCRWAPTGRPREAATATPTRRSSSFAKATSTVHCFLRAPADASGATTSWTCTRVECGTPLCLPGDQVRLVHASTRHMISKPSFGGDRLANYAAASTFYVSPSQELLLYATEHDNDGPSGTVKAGEWRHRDMVRDGSPTLRPTLTVNGPFTVDEGSVGTLSAAAKQPATKAWMQLFTELAVRRPLCRGRLRRLRPRRLQPALVVRRAVRLLPADAVVAVFRAALLQRAGSGRRRLRPE